tara:strand:- start:2360 stop:3262 length:903 start_codon:yes stop_codon:yes gene_type:complete
MNQPKKEEQLDLEIEEQQEESQDVEIPVQNQAENAETTVVQEDEPAQDQFEEAKNKTEKRINRLTKKMRDHEKNADDALKFAQQKEKENQELRDRLNKMDTSYLSEYTGRVDSQMAQAEATLKAAMELGDTESAVAAQKQISQLAVQADRASQAKAAQEKKVAQPVEQAQRQPQVQQTAPPPPPDPKAQAWAERNDWFGNDSAMTYAAFGIHKELVEQDGVDPKTDEYYTELDRRMSEEFPHKFADKTQSKKPVQNVASASRSSSGRSSGKKKVTLSARQVALSKKLGVPLEEYAKYVKE